VRREEVEDFVREGDIVTVRAVVLEVMSGAHIRTHQLHESEAVIGHERVFRPRDLVRGKADTGGLVWTIIHVDGHTAWVNRPEGHDFTANAFVETENLIHAFPATKVDTNPTS